MRIYPHNMALTDIRRGSGGTTFHSSSYIETKTGVAGTFTVDADKTGFTLDLATLTAPCYLKFCVRGVGANITATITPK